MTILSATIARRGFMFVLSSPSGAGKTTLSRLLLEADNNITMSVSATTRPMREGEVEGRDYYFMDKPRFEGMIAKDEFLEHAKVFDNFYGTPAEHVQKSLSAGKDVLFDIDWQGTEQLAQKCREDLVSIFILPPSLVELEKRLRNRARDPEDVIRRRMEKATDEISHWHAYDYVLVNEDIEVSLFKIRAILHAERLKRTRQQGLKGFVDTLMAS